MLVNWRGSICRLGRKWHSSRRLQKGESHWEKDDFGFQASNARNVKLFDLLENRMIDEAEEALKELLAREINEEETRALTVDLLHFTNKLPRFNPIMAGFLESENFDKLVSRLFEAALSKQGSLESATLLSGLANTQEYFASFFDFWEDKPGRMSVLARRIESSADLAQLHLALQIKLLWALAFLGPNPFVAAVAATLETTVTAEPGKLFAEPQKAADLFCAAARLAVLPGPKALARLVGVEAAEWGLSLGHLTRLYAAACKAAVPVGLDPVILHRLEKVVGEKIQERLGVIELAALAEGLLARPGVRRLDPRIAAATATGLASSDAFRYRFIFEKMFRVVSDPGLPFRTDLRLWEAVEAGAKGALKNARGLSAIDDQIFSLIAHRRFAGDEKSLNFLMRLAKDVCEVAETKFSSLSKCHLFFGRTMGQPSLISRSKFSLSPTAHCLLSKKLGLSPRSKLPLTSHPRRGDYPPLPTEFERFLTVETKLAGQIASIRASHRLENINLAKLMGKFRVDNFSVNSFDAGPFYYLSLMKWAEQVGISQTMLFCGLFNSSQFIADQKNPVVLCQILRSLAKKNPDSLNVLIEPNLVKILAEFFLTRLPLPSIIKKIDSLVAESKVTLEPKLYPLSENLPGFLSDKIAFWGLACRVISGKLQGIQFKAAEKSFEFFLLHNKHQGVLDQEKELMKRFLLRFKNGEFSKPIETSEDFATNILKEIDALGIPDDFEKEDDDLLKIY